jgi:hypothetical protein
MAAVISCAGDNELAKKLSGYLTSKFSPADVISLREDEITIPPGIKNDAVRKSPKRIRQIKP